MLRAFPDLAFPLYSSVSTRRLPSAAAALSRVLSDGQWVGFLRRLAAGQDVSSVRASSDNVRSPRASRSSMAAWVFASGAM